MSPRAIPRFKPADFAAPRARSSAARSEEIRFVTGQSTLGALLIAFSDEGVVAILMRDHGEALLDELQEWFPLAHLVAGDRSDASLLRKLTAHIEKPVGELDLPLDFRGTAFQQKVWKAVRDIPLGETSTYTEIARKIGKPKAIRAVGNSCSNNKLAIVVPCHRVLRSDGSLSGGSDWGTSRQGKLLERESAAK